MYGRNMKYKADNKIYLNVYNIGMIHDCYKSCGVSIMNSWVQINITNSSDRMRNHVEI
jgi:hypothetical protein